MYIFIASDLWPWITRELEDQLLITTACYSTRSNVYLYRAEAICGTRLGVVRSFALAGTYTLQQSFY